MIAGEHLTLRSKLIAVRSINLCCSSGTIHQITPWQKIIFTYSMKPNALVVMTPVVLMHEFMHCEFWSEQQPDSHDPVW